MDTDIRDERSRLISEWSSLSWRAHQAEVKSQRLRRASHLKHLELILAENIQDEIERAYAIKICRGLK